MKTTILAMIMALALLSGCNDQQSDFLKLEEVENGCTVIHNYPTKDTYTTICPSKGNGVEATR